MKPTKQDRLKGFILFFIRRIAMIWMKFDMKRNVINNGDFDFKRKEPYLMLANHTFMFDVIHVPLLISKVPFAVASQELFVRQPTKFLFKWIGRIIPKSKGSSDLRTAKMIISSIRRGYPVFIMPEGNTTFYGDTGHIEFSTMKLIKKLKVDVVTCNVRGGFLSRPRWAEGKRKNRYVELEYNVTIKKEELKTLSLDEIYDKIKDALSNNDYEFQRKRMIKHPGTELAKGIENVLYVCPECEGINTLHPDGNTITCTNCNTVGKVNEYGFIEGFKYDNTVDWDNYQKQLKDKLLKATINTTADLYFIRFEDSVKELTGKVSVQYKDHVITLDGAYQEAIPIEEVSNPIISLRRDLTFTYNKKYYHLKMDGLASSLLRVLQEKY